jgi:GT2 family glycosyltransferase
MLQVGIITVTYNSESVLGDFLDSISKQTNRDFILYIVDSGSTDGTIAKLAEIEAAYVRAICADKNIGFAAGCNVGIRLALQEGCDAILLLNNDTLFGPHMLQDLIDGLEKHNSDMTTPKMLYFDKPATIWAAGGHLNKWLGYRNHHDGENRPDDGRFDRPREVTFTPFCCILMRRSVIDKIGFLDENYFVYTEDVDYCLRSRKAGLKIWYIPQSQLWHKVNSLTGKKSDFLIYHSTRNRMYFMRKHLPLVLASFWYMLYRIYYLVDCLVQRTPTRVLKLRSSAARDGWAYRA